MNEFEWRRQLRALREPVAPPRDLWQRIGPALEQPRLEPSQPATTLDRRRSTQLPQWLLVAGFVGVSLLAVGLGLRQEQAPAAVAWQAAYSPAKAPWKPQDPRLAGAAIELDAASMQLRQAMQQAPDSAALQRLLVRTQQQRARLRHLDRAS